MMKGRSGRTGTALVVSTGDGHLPIAGRRARHLAGILDADGILPADRFWRLVADVLDEYEADHPGLARGLAGDVDLRAGSFALSCLRRLQLCTTLRMVDLGEQAFSLLFAGTMDNPVARAGVPV